MAAGLEFEGQFAAAFVLQLCLRGPAVARQAGALADVVEQILGLGVAFAFGPDQGLGLHQHDVGIAHQTAVERVPEFVALVRNLRIAARLPRRDELLVDQARRDVAGRVRGDRAVGAVAAESDVAAHEPYVVAGVENRGFAALVALLESVPELLARRVVSPRVVEAPAGIDECHAVVARAVRDVAFQREDVFRAVVLLLAPEVGERLGLVTRVDVERTLVGSGQGHYLVAHFDHDVVVRLVVLRGIERGAGGESPCGGFVRQAVLVGGELREVGQLLGRVAEVLDDLVVVLQHVVRTRRVHGVHGRRVEDDGNAAVRIVAVVGNYPEHREAAEEIGGSEGQLLHRRGDAQVGNQLDDVVGLGHVLVHDAPDLLHVLVVGGGHAEFADFVHGRTVAADEDVVAGAFEPHVSAAADLLAPVGRYEVVECIYGLHDVFVRFPRRVAAVGFPVEEIGTARER